MQDSSIDTLISSSQPNITLNHISFINSTSNSNNLFQFTQSSTIRNCIFENLSVTSTMYSVISLENAYIEGCTFKRCFITANDDVRSNGVFYTGVLYMLKGMIDNCAFIDCSYNVTSLYNQIIPGVIRIKSDGTLSNSLILNCTFTISFPESNYGGLVYIGGKGEVNNLTIKYCLVNTLSDGYFALLLFYDVTLLHNTLISQSRINTCSTGALVFFIRNGSISNCNFDRCSIATTVPIGSTLLVAAVIMNYGNITLSSFTDMNINYNDTGSFVNPEISLVKINYVGEVTGVSFNNCLINSNSSFPLTSWILDTGQYDYVRTSILSNTSFVNCMVNVDGNLQYAGIFTAINYNISDSLFYNCSFSYLGQLMSQSVYASIVYLTGQGSVEGTVFDGCSVSFPYSCSYAGGILYIFRYEATVSRSIFRDCTLKYQSSSSYGAKSLPMRGGIVYLYVGGSFLYSRISNCSVSLISGTNDDLVNITSGVLYIARSGSVAFSSFDNSFIYISYALQSIGGVVVIVQNGTVENSNFENCAYLNTGEEGKAYDVRGGIVYIGTNGVIDQSSFTNCIFNWTLAGGIVNIYGDSAQITNSNFSTCYSTWDGGAVFSNSAIIQNSYFENTISEGNGGAVYLQASSQVISSSFLNCRSKLNGGGLYLIVFGTIEGSSFTNCTATLGGGVYLQNGGEIDNSEFSDCLSSKNGSAVYSLSSLVFQNSTLSGCECQNGSGGVYCTSNSTILNSNFSNNSAEFGSSVFLNHNSSITHSSFINNVGSGTVFTEQTGIIEESNFENNFGINGVAIYCSKNLFLFNSYFYSNNASGDGLNLRGKFHSNSFMYLQ